MHSLCTSRSRRATLAGAGATLLAALAITAPAGAATVIPSASGYSSAADQVGLNFTNTAQDFHFTDRAQDFHFRSTPG